MDEWGIDWNNYDYSPVDWTNLFSDPSYTASGFDLPALSDISFLPDGSVDWNSFYDPVSSSLGLDLPSNFDWNSLFNDGSATSAGGVSGGGLSSALGSLFSGSNASKLLPAIAGGLLGSQGSQQTGEQSIKSVPWDLQQPYLLDMFSKAQQTAGLPTTELNNMVGSGLDAYSQLINGTGPVNPFASQDNPYLQNMINNAQGDVTRQYNTVFKPTMDANFSRAGAYGGSAWNEANANMGHQLTSDLGNIENQLRFGDYTNRSGLAENAVNRQTTAIGNAPAYGAQSWGYKFSPVTNYGAAISGNYGNTQTQPLYSNPLMNALGGGLLGMQVGKSLFGA